MSNTEDYELIFVLFLNLQKVLMVKEQNNMEKNWGLNNK